jgi:hypothetical protein
MFIVRLLAAASVTDDRITFTSGTLPQDDLRAARGPIRLELVRRRGKWDKNNRSSLELCPTGVDLPRSEPEAELLPPETKIQLEENNPSGLQLLGVSFRILAGYNRQYAHNLAISIPIPILGHWVIIASFLPAGLS